VLPKNTSRDTMQLELVNVDFCKPFLFKSLANYFNFMTFIDDCFRKAQVYFLKEECCIFKVLIYSNNK
jgi:hypothetical protein